MENITLNKWNESFYKMMTQDAGTVVKKFEKLKSTTSKTTYIFQRDTVKNCTKTKTIFYTFF